MKLTPTIYSVSDFVDLVNGQLKEMTMAIQGEITSLTMRNHAYFSLSDSNPDEKAVLSCALWKFRLNSLPFDLKEGMEVQVVGKASLYKPTGRFTFVVDHIVPVGEGSLQKAFEALKKKLDEKGYFSVERKRKLPEFPKNIGLLTSEAGDAIRDFKKHLGEFGFTVVHKDVMVEGINSIDSIVAGIRWFNEHPDVIENGIEVLVITRGGGSLESLQAFNSEAVAQAIFASKIPVVSAVGHERDITIADLVSDVRASTPTDAGRVISDNWRIAQKKLQYYSQSLFQVMDNLIKKQQEKMLSQWEKITNIFFSEMESFFEKRRYFFQSILSHFSKIVIRDKQWLDNSEKQLKAHDPHQKLKQGYSLIKDDMGRIIRTIDKIKTSQKIKLIVSDGSFGATVTKKDL